MPAEIGELTLEELSEQVAYLVHHDPYRRDDRRFARLSAVVANFSMCGKGDATSDDFMPPTKAEAFKEMSEDEIERNVEQFFTAIGKTKRSK